jgi:hypothetical protein
VFPFINGLEVRGKFQELKLVSLQLCNVSVQYIKFLNPKQPTNQETKLGRSPAQARDVIPCQIKPFLLTKRISVTGRESHKYSNYGYGYANELNVLAEGLDMSRLGAINTGGKMNR